MGALIEILLLVVCSVAIRIVHVNANLFLSGESDHFRMLPRLSLDITAIFASGYTLYFVSAVMLQGGLWGSRVSSRCSCGAFWMERSSSASAPWFLPSVFPSVLPLFVRGVGKRYAVTSDFLMGCRSNFGKRVRLTWKTRPGIPLHGVPVPGHPKPRRWKRLLPLAPLDQGERRAGLSTFFLALGLVESRRRGCVEPASRGYRHGVSGWSVQPKGLVHWHQPAF